MNEARTHKSLQGMFYNIDPFNGVKAKSQKHDQYELIGISVAHCLYDKVFGKFHFILCRYFLYKEL